MAALGTNNTIKELDFSNNIIEDEGAKTIIQKLENLLVLTKLDLSKFS